VGTNSYREAGGAGAHECGLVQVGVGSGAGRR